MPAPGPITDRLEAARCLVVGITPPARQPQFERRGRLVVDVLAALDACPDRIRQNLREALHLGRGVGRIDEAGTLEDGLESGHKLLWVNRVSSNRYPAASRGAEGSSTPLWHPPVAPPCQGK